MFSDKNIVCKDCGQTFAFTASEQEFFAEKGFSNEPQRCKDCRTARKQNSRGSEQRMILNSSSTSASVSGEVGSSSTRIFGFRLSARAIDTI